MVVRLATPPLRLLKRCWNPNGTRLFDAAFAIMASHDDNARLLLGDTIRNDLLALYPRAFSYDGSDRGQPRHRDSCCGAR
jgi:hypothetical protein